MLIMYLLSKCDLLLQAFLNLQLLLFCKIMKKKTLSTALVCMYRCELRCSYTKACGRHQCRRRCCEGDCPPCDLPCGRRLPCSNHKCPAPCHRGPCLPCPLSSTVACACGQTKYTLPCGSESKAAPPQCWHMCPIKPTCRHAAARPAHR